ncbi:MAG: hypothetical protein GY896_22860 [Gammaproteobacteria bacterium]|nr:hypothetical protein [Gammaproteobacteria bacterium]
MIPAAQTKNIASSVMQSRLGEKDERQKQFVPGPTLRLCDCLGAFFLVDNRMKTAKKPCRVCEGTGKVPIKGAKSGYPTETMCLFCKGQGWISVSQMQPLRAVRRNRSLFKSFYEALAMFIVCGAFVLVLYEIEYLDRLPASVLLAVLFLLFWNAHHRSR